MRNAFLHGTLAILGFGIAACNPSTTTSSTPAQTQTASQPTPGSKNEPVSAAKDAVAGAVGAVKAQLTTSTKGFVEAASMGDMYEIESSKMALLRARSDDVKKFAQSMIDAHTQTTNDLKAALKRSGVTMAMPAAFDARYQGFRNDLKGATAEDFDGRYITQQQNAHQEALIRMRAYAKDGDNADVKSFAAMTAPKVQMHLDMLQGMDESLKASQRRADNRR